MKKAMLYGFLAAMTLTLSVACGTKKDDDKAKVDGREGQARVAGNSGLPTMPYNQQVVTVTSAQLEAMAKALASGSIELSNIGNITGVQIQGNVKVNAQTGAIIPASSAILIRISDSLVGKDNGNGTIIEPISIYVAGISGYAVGGQVNLVFGDAIGTITIQGSFNQTTFNGTVSFNNTQGPGFNNVRAGTLGQFTVGTCQFFNCQ